VAGRENRVGGGRYSGHAAGRGGRWQCRFVMRGGGGGHAASGGPAAGPTWGEGKWARPKKNSDFFIQMILK
jgi:hypothetical protein